MSTQSIQDYSRSQQAQLQAGYGGIAYGYPSSYAHHFQPSWQTWVTPTASSAGGDQIISPSPDTGIQSATSSTNQTTTPPPAVTQTGHLTGQIEAHGTEDIYQTQMNHFAHLAPYHHQSIQV